VVEGKDMFIDIGLLLPKGCHGSGHQARARRYPSTGPLHQCKAILLQARPSTNRAGLVMMIEALKRTKSKSTIYAVAAVQEEVGLKGAKVAAFGLDPDLAIAADVTFPETIPHRDERMRP